MLFRSRGLRECSQIRHRNELTEKAWQGTWKQRTVNKCFKMKHFVCLPARVELQSSFKQILVQLTSGAVDDNFGQLSSKPVKKIIPF